MSAKERLDIAAISGKPLTPGQSKSQTWQAGQMVGLIRAPKEIEEKETPKIDQPELESFSEGSQVSGVVAASITLNSMMPLQYHPETWDVFSTPVALVNSSLTGLRLPNPQPKIMDYIMSPDPAEAPGGSGDQGEIEVDGDDEQIEYDEACLLLPETPTRQKLPGGGQHNSYCISAKAIVTEAEFDFPAFLETLPNVDVMMLDWAGPFAFNAQHIARVSIASHEISGYGIPRDFIISHVAEDGFSTQTHGNRPVIVFDQIDPRVGAGVWDLLFMSLNGGRWQLYATRES